MQSLYTDLIPCRWTGRLNSKTGIVSISKPSFILSLTDLLSCSSLPTLWKSFNCVSYHPTTYDYPCKHPTTYSSLLTPPHNNLLYLYKCQESSCLYQYLLVIHAGAKFITSRKGKDEEGKGVTSRCNRQAWGAVCSKHTWNRS